jgi:hypothetical protein
VKLNNCVRKPAREQRRKKLFPSWLVLELEMWNFYGAQRALADHHSTSPADILCCLRQLQSISRICVNLPRETFPATPAEFKLLSCWLGIEAAEGET